MPANRVSSSSENRRSALGVGEHLLHRHDAEDRLLGIDRADRSRHRGRPSALGSPVRADDERHLLAGKALAREIELLARRLVGRHLAHVARHADDGDPRAPAGPNELDPPADRVLARPVLVRHRPVDHDLGRAGRVEPPPRACDRASSGNLPSSGSSRASPAAPRPTAGRLIGRRRPAFDLEAGVRRARGSGSRRDQRHLSDAGHLRAPRPAPGRRTRAAARR